MHICWNAWRNMTCKSFWSLHEVLELAEPVTRGCMARPNIKNCRVFHQINIQCWSSKLFTFEPSTVLHSYIVSNFATYGCGAQQWWAMQQAINHLTVGLKRRSLSAPIRRSLIQRSLLLSAVPFSSSYIFLFYLFTVLSSFFAALHPLIGCRRDSSTYIPADLNMNAPSSYDPAPIYDSVDIDMAIKVLSQTAFSSCTCHPYLCG
jgi:hypothetical protein